MVEPEEEKGEVDRRTAQDRQRLDREESAGCKRWNGSLVRWNPLFTACCRADLVKQ